MTSSSGPSALSSSAVGSSAVGSSTPRSSSPVWAVPRGTEGIRIMVDGGVARGMTTTECLAGTGLDAADLDDETAQIWAHQEFVVIRNLLGELGDRPGLGAGIGAHSTLGRTGVIGFMMLAGPTVRAALDRAIPYLALSPTHLRFSLEEGSAGATGTGADVDCLLAADDEIPADVRTFVVERDLAGLAAALRGAQIDVGITGLETTLGPESAVILGESWGLTVDEVRPYAERNRLAITRERLDARLPQGDENTAKLFERQCRELLDDRLARVGVAGQVRSRLRHERETWPSMTEVAGELHIDVRTLRRRLAAEGTSFRRLLDEVRHHRALELLALRVPVSEVARELGYSETATFTRTFIRWEGVPPSRARRAGQIERVP
ncbi:MULTISPECIES: AraC family transcriptional regulator [unclassified Dietzia]|uniref:AraC family transcriptional regulator n=1 Tax=unclassified Dietzia TaxID=2617939 RepID=UPI000D228C51|nr:MULTISPECIES: AraC family transcriptional regulator [unclassified Dietzia]AVZ38225.1 AraC family transcriptional regulator [Dietzia sp. JS16-p6b]MBB1025816.1 AraC family transcriptional regulator [Dietzia sp. DQ12-76]MBB1028762.1 AraC family transcriptional regulator [Dietzia sp. DQ11-38-2]QGW23210.1 transcriptional regulator, AraC family protein [Dietzia sp. DQ12-45-1b]